MDMYTIEALAGDALGYEYCHSSVSRISIRCVFTIIYTVSYVQIMIFEMAR